MSATVSLAVPVEGEPAPDLVLDDQTGAPVRLAELWSGAPRAFVLVFVRHFG